MDHISKHLQVVQQKQELVRQESKLPAIGEEGSLAKALEEPKIKQLNELEPLHEALRMAMVMVGLREENFPVGEETNLLLSFIIENYGGHTASEIKLAFKMAISGKLELETKDVVCYQNFSVLYFSSIMNAYRSWSKEAVFHLPKPIEQKAITYNSDVTDEEFIESVKTIYQASKKWQSIPVLAYEVLVRMEKIVLNNNQKHVIKKHVDASHPELPEETRKEYYKSFAVMLFFENKTVEG